MLKLKKIKKSYKTASFTQHALEDVSINFRRHEFVSILGPSGSGKTTLLNIIGGLDRYDSGDLIINEKSTKQFKSKDWDAYRNNCIGFIFQSYNLITHLSILENVEMGMTLSGINKKKRRKKAIEVLKKVGLKDHIYKKPNQLSGGQMQRVAIARALANDPDIILADEPTGALDSKTSVQIMDLINEISKNKLVIMVTHNPELANTYANRIIELKDGKLISDSNPYSEEEKIENFKIKKTAMNLLTALKLSFNNILTKKGRTLLTAFASSIGIIGIATILSLSNGFNIEVEEFEKNSLSSLPIMITEQAMDIDEDVINSLSGKELISYPNEEIIYAQKDVQEQITHKNTLTKEYIDYIEKINPDYVSGISYTRITAINTLVKANDKAQILSSSYFTVIPKSLDENKNSVLEDTYDLLKGSLPSNKNEVIVLVDSYNRLPQSLLKLFGIEDDKINFDEIIGKEIKVVFNDDLYNKIGANFIMNYDFNSLYENKNNLTLKISGIIRGKEDNMLASAGFGLAYHEDLVDYVVKINSDSNIVKFQQESDYNVLTGEQFNLEEKEGMEAKAQILSYLGADSIPVMINIYPTDFDSKDEVINYLDAYNDSHEEDIMYTDMGNLISTLSGGMMDAITIVLIGFSSISLVVSSIMIGIITYISVLERTKEIGILRALGARGKDITRVFNAETFIIGLTSGIIGILISRLLIIPINRIIEDLSGLENVAKMNPVHVIILLIISIILTLIGGFIPAKIASRKDQVIALRTE